MDSSLRLSNYQKSDFERLILPIKELPMSEDLYARFPMLNKLEGFDYRFHEFKSPQITKNLFVRYIVLFYSKGISVLEAQFPEFLKRKTACAILAGFEYNEQTGTFNKQVEEAITGKNAMCNRMIVSMIKHNYSDEYSTYCLLRDKYYKFLLNETDDNAKDTKAIIDMSKQLQDYRTSFLNGDRHERINAALVMHIEETSLGIRPEEIAKLLYDGKSPIEYEAYA